MDKNQTVSGLSMAERREKGLLWIDTGENLNQQVYARGLCQEFKLATPISNGGLILTPPGYSTGIR